MLHKTRGIVIGYIPYRETSVIVRIYTEQFGLQSYIENGVRSSKGRNKIALFQPLTLLDLVVYHKDRGGIQRISEAKCSIPFRSLPFDIAKSSLALFVTEILGKVLREETGNELLFEFLYESIRWLDETTGHAEHFHLVFLLKLSFFLGFSPQSGKEIAEQLQEHTILHTLDNQSIILVDSLIRANYESTLKTDRFTRNQLLETILKFYQLHIENMGEIRSLAVLKEVLR